MAIAKAQVEVEVKGARQARRQLGDVQDATRKVGEEAEGNESRFRGFVDVLGEVTGASGEMTESFTDGVDAVDGLKSQFEKLDGVVDFVLLGISALTTGIALLSKTMSGHTQEVANPLAEAYNNIARQVGNALKEIELVNSLAGSAGFSSGYFSTQEQIRLREGSAKRLEIEKELGELIEGQVQAERARAKLQAQSGTTTINLLEQEQNARRNLLLFELEGIDEQQKAIVAAAQKRRAAEGLGLGASRAPSGPGPRDFEAEQAQAIIELFAAANKTAGEFSEGSSFDVIARGLFLATSAAGEASEAFNSLFQELDPTLSALFAIDSAAYDIGETFRDDVVPYLHRAADGFARAAIESVLFGEVAEDKINAVADAMLVEATLEATKAGIKALGAGLLGRPALAAGFAQEAGMWAALAGTSAAIGAASGGVGASRRSGGGVGGADEVGFSPRDFDRNDRKAETAEIHVHQNFGGAILASEDVGKATSRAIDEYAYSRGATPFRHVRLRGRG